jgi:hypothetical protein
MTGEIDLQRARGAEAEKDALCMDYEQYICYCMEIDKENVNSDGVEEVANLLAYHKEHPQS